MVSVPAKSQTHNFPSRTYAMCFPSGLIRGSKTASDVLICWVFAVTRLVTKSFPATQYAALSTCWSHEYPTIPDAPSRARSRRACSAAVSICESPDEPLIACSAIMSATQVSTDVVTSNTYRELTESEPPRDRQYTTRVPSGDTTMLRGSPSVSRCVRANCRGNVSVAFDKFGYPILISPVASSVMVLPTHSVSHMS